MLEDTDIAKAIVEFVSQQAIEKLVLGAPSKGGFVRWSSQNLTDRYNIMLVNLFMMNTLQITFLFIEIFTDKFSPSVENISSVKASSVKLYELWHKPCPVQHNDHVPAYSVACTSV